MKNYGKVQSLNRPQEIEIKESKVFIASNIQPYSATVGEYEETGYEYDYIEYTKDEYIQYIIIIVISYLVKKNLPQLRFYWGWSNL